MNRKQRRSKKGAFALAPDGLKLAVIRPSNPTLALEIAKLALKHNDSKLFADLPAQTGCDYTFMGWLEAGGHRILDKDGHPIGELQPGDSFITFDNDAN